MLIDTLAKLPMHMKHKITYKPSNNKRVDMHKNIAK